MIGHIDDHGILIGKLLGNSHDDGVVIKHGVVVVGHDEFLFVGQVRTVVHRCQQVLTRLLGITLLIHHMLSHQMENHQVVRLVFPLQGVVFLKHALVELMETCVTGVKLRLTQLRVVQEKAAAEIIDRLPRFGQKLVGDERHVIARLTEHLREERTIAPLPWITDSMK